MILDVVGRVPGRMVARGAVGGLEIEIVLTIQLGPVWRETSCQIVVRMAATDHKKIGPWVYVGDVAPGGAIFDLAVEAMWPDPDRRLPVPMFLDRLVELVDPRRWPALGPAVARFSL